MIEARRAEEDRFAWTVPGFAIAAQAFLLAIVLNANVTSLARFLASLAGLMAAAAAAHLYGKNVYLFDLYEAYIHFERRRLGLHSVQLDALREFEYPSDTNYVKRKWADESSWRYRLIVDHKTANVWLGTLFGFVLVDLALLLYSFLALCGADPHWLDHAQVVRFSK